MLVTFVTAMVLVGSVLLVITNLGTVADDTAQALRGALSRMRGSGGAASLIAMAVLWLTIFGLSYL